MRGNGLHLKLVFFEVPSMLAYQGKELGTVELRHFLEIPIADWLRNEHGSHGRAGDSVVCRSNHQPSRDMLSTYRADLHPEATGKHARQEDLCQNMNGGPDDWKRIGVRNITIDALTDRLIFDGNLA